MNLHLCDKQFHCNRIFFLMINFVHRISNFKVYLSSQVVRLRATEISYKMIFCRLLIFVPIFVGLLAGCFHLCHLRRVLNYICLITPKTLVKVLWYRVTGFFFMLSVVKCRQITSTVINYHVGWTISRYVT